MVDEIIVHAISDDLGARDGDTSIIGEIVGLSVGSRSALLALGGVSNEEDFAVGLENVVRTDVFAIIVDQIVSIFTIDAHGRVGGRIDFASGNCSYLAAGVWLKGVVYLTLQTTYHSSHFLIHSAVEDFLGRSDFYTLREI